MLPGYRITPRGPRAGPGISWSGESADRLSAHGSPADKLFGDCSIVLMSRAWGSAKSLLYSSASLQMRFWRSSISSTLFARAFTVKEVEHLSCF